MPDVMGQTLGRRLRRDSIVAFLGVVLGMASGLGANALLARLISPRQLGTYFLAFSMMTLVSIVGRVGINHAVIRFASEAMARDEPGGAHGTVRASLVLAAGCGVVAATVLYSVAGRWIANSLFEDALLATTISWVALWVMFEVIRVVTADAFRGLSDVPQAVMYSQVSRPVIALAGFAAIRLTIDSVEIRTVLAVAVGASAVSCALAGLSLLRKLRSLGAPAQRSAWPIVAVGLPLMVTQLTFALVRQGDLWVVGAFRSESSVALYGAALQLATLAGVPLLVMNSFLSPVIAELNVRGERVRLELLLRAAATVAGIPMIALLVVGAAIGRPVVTATFGSFYSASFVMFLFLGAGQVFSVVMGANGLALAMTGHQRVVMTTALAAAVLTVTGEVAVVAPFGPTAVAAVSGAGTIVNNIALVWLTKRRLGIWTCASLSPALVRSAWQRSRSDRRDNTDGVV